MRVRSESGRYLKPLCSAELSGELREAGPDVSLAEREESRRDPSRGTREGWRLLDLLLI